MHFPNVFSPNGDGRNDRFRAMLRCSVSDFSMRVYNRWGESVYSTDKKDGYWDGTHHGVDAPVGVYMYFVSFTHPVSRRLVFTKGEVMLLR
jgi:gliding motility-associated-like protein